MKPFSWLLPGGSRARHQVLIFHRVPAQHDPMMPDEPSAAAFDQLIGSLAKQFNILPLSEAVDRAAQGKLPASSISITFDDGYADNFTQALPILEKHGAHATFFIATGFLDGGRMWNDTIIETVRALPDGEHPNHLHSGQVVQLNNFADRRTFAQQVIDHYKHKPIEERAELVRQFAAAYNQALPDDLMMNSQQLVAMANSAAAEIGAHTQNHPILATLSAQQAQQEILHSFDALEAKLGKRPQLFAYPNGKVGRDYLPEQAKWLGEQGIKAAVATDWGTLTRATDPMQIPRFSPWNLKPWRFTFDLIRARYAWY